MPPGSENVEQPQDRDTGLQRVCQGDDLLAAFRLAASVELLALKRVRLAQQPSWRAGRILGGRAGMDHRRADSRSGAQQRHRQLPVDEIRHAGVAG